jgi:cytochrome c biogenesis protein CcdA
MATNITAISFIGRNVQSSRSVMGAGILYTLGRSLAYIGLAAILVSGLLAVPDVSQFLQRYINKLLGPILIIVGVVVLEMVTFSLPGARLTDRIGKFAEKSRWWSPIALGILFALSFCPVSAALFFVSLLPLAMTQRSPVILPLIYGIGTALPVIAVAFAIAMGGNAIGTAYKRISTFEKIARWVTGAAFIAVGLFLTLKEIYGLF